MTGPAYCGSCGAPQREGSRFCGRCGRPVSTVPAMAPAPAPPAGEYPAGVDVPPPLPAAATTAATATEDAEAPPPVARPGETWIAGYGPELAAAALRREGTARERREHMEREDRASWTAFRPVLACWCCLLALNGVVGLAFRGSESTPSWLLLAVDIAFAGIVIAFSLPAWRELDPLLGRAGINRSNWWWPLAALGAMAAMMKLYFFALDFLGVKTELITDDYLKVGWSTAAIFLSIAALPGFFEEVAFRGLIYGRLSRLMKPLDALIVQAAMFSVLHMAILNFVSHFLMGLIFGVLRLRTGSLWPGILVHAAWNASLVACELQGWSWL